MIGCLIGFYVYPVIDRFLLQSRCELQEIILWLIFNAFNSNTTNAVIILISFVERWIHLSLERFIEFADNFSIWLLTGEPVISTQIHQLWRFKMWKMSQIKLWIRIQIEQWKSSVFMTRVSMLTLWVVLEIDLISCPGILQEFFTQRQRNSIYCYTLAWFMRSAVHAKLVSSSSISKEFKEFHSTGWKGSRSNLRQYWKLFTCFAHLTFRQQLPEADMWSFWF